MCSLPRGARTIAKAAITPRPTALEGGFLLHRRSRPRPDGPKSPTAGVTLSGGEPFCQANALCPVAAGAHALGKSVVTFTGYTFEELHRRAAADPWTARLLDLTDLLIDGPYVEELRDLELQFRGSSNQRLLDHAARARLAAKL